MPEEFYFYCALLIVYIIILVSLINGKLPYDDIEADSITNEQDIVV
ncbi:MAG: hypothetical protein IJ272_02370 [Clostridia bacterium]|nr:hypothetical protein [Clostridia bacterium]